MYVKDPSSRHVTSMHVVSPCLLGEMSKVGSRNRPVASKTGLASSKLLRSLYSGTFLDELTQHAADGVPREHFIVLLAQHYLFVLPGNTEDKLGYIFAMYHATYGLDRNNADGGGPIISSVDVECLLEYMASYHPVPEADDDVVPQRHSTSPSPPSGRPTTKPSTAENDTSSLPLDTRRTPPAAAAADAPPLDPKARNSSIGKFGRAVGGGIRTILLHPSGKTPPSSSSSSGDTKTDRHPPPPPLAHVDNHHYVGGYLHKVSDGKWAKRNWHLRWFVLDMDRGVLAYYKSNPSSIVHSPHGSVWRLQLVVDGRVPCLVVLICVNVASFVGLNYFGFLVQVPVMALATYYFFRNFDMLSSLNQSTDDDKAEHAWSRHAAAYGKIDCIAQHVNVPPSVGNSRLFILHAQALRTPDSPATHLLARFLNASDPAILDRFKVIAQVVNEADCGVTGYTKKLLTKNNGTPVLTRPQHRMYHTPAYTEVDVDVHVFSLVARTGIHALVDKTAGMLIDVAFVLQGESDDELPEQVLGVCRLVRVDLSKAAHVADVAARSCGRDA
ncbi:hypothetical protein DYB35_002554 [Aphanomyces astaci]|uniref:Protein ENHANCED DISEASE RESISTANCE 2 C-terminal domain-containing protein n=1 Tax=Aphanomyces astaci TaxID=112090 RepID=A0A418DQ39_APHAT|nr:hypothetical protein DYB35_002554 [Aphanomyces astaci]